MLHKIRLENFRKHADLTVSFTAGINAIRAPNEAGKTTLLEAIAYALFGTKGLKESIDDVVTYDMPVSKLRVALDFDHAGVAYNIKRSKSGAELNGTGVKVTGQTEVTKFVEKLLGTSADMASKLMLAKQKGLGGALSGGPREAGAMIEDLAGIDLIQRYIDLITEHLVAGQTAAAEANVASARARTEPVALNDLAGLQATHDGAEKQLKDVSVAADCLRTAQDELDLVAANAILADEARLSAASKTRAAQFTSLTEKLAAALPEAPAPAAIQALRDKIEAQKGLAAAAKLHAELKAANVSPDWDENLVALEAEIGRVQEELEGAAAKVRDITAQASDGAKVDRETQHAICLEIAQVEGKLVKEESCTFCGKDLKDIPEVALVNNPLNARLRDLKVQLVEAAGAWTKLSTQLNDSLVTAQAQVTEKTGYLRDLQTVAAQHNRLAPLYARAEAFITLDHGTVPATWTWTGPTDAPQDFAGELASLLEQDRNATAAAAARGEQQKQLQALAKEAEADNLTYATLQIDEAKDTLVQFDALKPKVAAAEADVAAARAALAAAAGALATEKALQAQILEQQEKAKVELAAAEAVLLEMNANNALIKKLRAARPQITDKLWAGVLAATSRYVADVRGERSTITREDNGFKVNGKPVTGLSGSAEDTLGLGLRLALTKMFLPNIDFLNLDEVAAACDDQREVAMLGLLATAGFKQVILVTHSALADAFADNIITI